MRRSGLGLALAAIVSVLALLAAPAAWADTAPTLTDATPGTPPALVGDTITLTPGTYTADPTGSAVVDTWYDCDAAAPTTPAGCTYLQGSGTTYQVASADQGRYIVVFETDTPLTAGTQSAAIPVQLPPVGPSPPSAVTDPAILGTPISGTTLTADNGTWLGATSFSDSWSRCQSNGSGCQQVATGPTYSLTSSDVGAQILLSVTAIGPGGTAPGNPALFGPITTPVQTVSPPSVGSAQPTLSGTPQVGSTVAGTPVTMSNNPSYTYQWARCPTSSSCTAIGGATATTYTPSAADLGDSLQFVETGTNAGGSATVRSPQSANVTAPTETTLQLTPPTIVAGQPVTLIATVTSATGAAPPAGTVLFSNSGTPVPGCNSIATQPSGASATVTCRTTFGSAPSGLSAVFTPAAGSLVTGSDSNAGGFVVGRAPTTTKVKVPRHLTIGHRATLVARVRPAPGTKGITPAGTVVFVDGSKPIKGCVVTLSGNAARCSVTYHKLRTHMIAADYLGDAAFSGSSSRTHKTNVTIAKPKGFVSALMAWTFRFSPTSTQVATLRVTGLVPGDAVALVCSGDRCPLRHHVYRTTKRSCGKRHHCKPLDLAKRLHHARLGIGAKLIVRITHRSWLGKYYRFVVRRGRKPKIVTSCLAVGMTRPNVACSPR
ncbi:MAG TPA: Ig-like domain repeat protein [Solirubrobacteraceae bacterium]|nr:Ig-like domain repeat protein [Solirubrobacteraceae bacterium]